MAAITHQDILQLPPENSFKKYFCVIVLHLNVNFDLGRNFDELTTERTFLKVTERK